MFERIIALLEARLLEHIQSGNSLKEPMEYALFSGGKRLRPLLLLLMLKDLEIEVEHGLDVACAIEMIHTYSLIHDDLPAMDNDDMRRGKPTVHIVFGEDIAILAGDALLTEAFLCISQSQLPDVKKIALITNIARLIGARGMIYGQWLDIKNTKTTLEDIAVVHQHKTTDLIKCAMNATSIIADKDALFFEEIANHLGCAFQIKDDLDDIEQSDNNSIVKAIGIEQARTMFFEQRTKCLLLIEEKLGRKDTYQLVESIL